MRLLSSFGATVCAVAILFTSTSGCGSDSSSTAPAANVDELFELGSFEVGYREITISYDDAGTANAREVLLRVWYPAQDGSNAPPARYAVGGIVDIPTEVALDAPPITDEANLPFAIYSHGNGGEGLLGYPYGELMASHGWILVAPNHTGNTALDFLDSPDPFTRSALDRPNDISAIIDELESGLAGDELAGKVDASSVFLFGHSFGGYTTFVSGGAGVDFDALATDCEGQMSDACDLIDNPDVEEAFRAGFLDERIVALAPQAPAIGPIADGELAALEVPTMLMSGLLDQTTTQEESAEPAWAGIDHPDDIWVEMPAGAHFTFITICHDLTPDLLDFFRPDAGEDGCGEEFIDTREAVPVLAAYVFAFGRRHVLGQTEWDAVLKGPALGNEGDFVIRVK
ncbi:MAG: alpha/beta hydrolase family protein [Polyangiales bacterium]